MVHWCKLCVHCASRRTGNGAGSGTWLWHRYIAMSRSSPHAPTRRPASGHHEAVCFTHFRLLPPHRSARYSPVSYRPALLCSRYSSGGCFRNSASDPDACAYHCGNLCLSTLSFFPFFSPPFLFSVAHYSRTLELSRTIANFNAVDSPVRSYALGLCRSLNSSGRPRQSASLTARSSGATSSRRCRAAISPHATPQTSTRMHSFL